MMRSRICLCTVLFEIDGSPDRVRKTLDRVMLWCADRLRGGDSAKESTSLADVFLPRLHRTGDGIWYLQVGIQGPAVSVIDKWVVIGFSPQAVRQNVEFIVSRRKPSRDANR